MVEKYPYRFHPYCYIKRGEIALACYIKRGERGRLHGEHLTPFLSLGLKFPWEAAVSCRLTTGFQQPHKARLHSSEDKKVDLTYFFMSPTAHGQVLYQPMAPLPCSRNFQRMGSGK
jgi:hypothetical protein